MPKFRVQKLITFEVEGPEVTAQNAKAYANRVLTARDRSTDAVVEIVGVGKTTVRDARTDREVWREV